MLVLFQYLYVYIFWGYDEIYFGEDNAIKYDLINNLYRKSFPEILDRIDKILEIEFPGIRLNISQWNLLSLQNRICFAAVFSALLRSLEASFD